MGRVHAGMVWELGMGTILWVRGWDVDELLSSCHSLAGIKAIIQKVIHNSTCIKNTS